MNNNQNVPKVRFKGFNDAWEQRKLGEVFETVTDYVAAGSFADIAKNVQYQSEKGYAQLVRTVDLKAKFHNSDFVYVNKNAFEYLYRVNLDKECIILPNVGVNCGEVYYVEPSTLVYERNVLGPNAVYIRSENSNNKFLSAEFETDDFKNNITVIVASSGQPKFNKTELKSIVISIPTRPEQDKIADYFTDLDNLITLHQREHYSVGFDKFGAENAQNTISWEQRKVSDLFKITRGYVLATTLTEPQKTDNTPYPVYSSQTKDKGLMGYYKDFLYEDAITWTTDGANAGTVSYRAGKFYCTNVCGVLLSDNVTANQMIAEALNNVAKGYVSYVGNPKLMNNVMADIEIYIPPKAEERERISEYFLALDNLITLHQRKKKQRT